MQLPGIFLTSRKLLQFYAVRCLIILFCLTLTYDFVQAKSPKELFMLSSEALKRGDFISAERFLVKIIEKKEGIKEDNLITVYNELGIINKLLGRYDKALKYYFAGVNIALQNSEDLKYKLPSLYNNLGNVFKLMGDYKKALEYYNESIKNVDFVDFDGSKKMIEKEHAYHNIGLTYYLQKDYSKAMNSFQQSIDIITKYNLDGVDITYNNFANCLRKKGDYAKAENYYKKCIQIRTKKYGKEYYKLAYVYKDYGKLKHETNNYSKAYDLYNKALKIHLKNFGAKHPNTAEMYQIIGDYYTSLNKFDQAILFYQKSLISNSKNFNTTDIFENPDTENTFSKIQLLRSLKKKAEVLILLAQNDRKGLKDKLNLCIKTIDKAVLVIKKIRKGYVSLESKLYITANEKEVYLTGIANALKLYELTKNKKYLKKAYSFSRISKAAILLEEMNQNQAMTTNIPDSLINEKNDVLQDIAALEKLIFDENQQLNPNVKRVKQWQSTLFSLDKKYENILQHLSKNYPIYSEFTAKPELLSLSEIQDKLAKSDVLIEYSYFITENKGKLYAFVIDQNQIKYHEKDIDSSFEEYIDFSRNKMNQSAATFTNLAEYNSLNKKLFLLYELLIKPHKISKNSNIIIVPDEKLAYLSFDALISDYHDETYINYAGLPYLLYDYQFSYVYSSSLLAKNITSQNCTTKVFAFAPAYDSGITGKMRNLHGELKNANTEIRTILEHFEGTSFMGDSATKINFTANLKHQGIYHLAMHANADEEHHEYSYLAFSQVKGKKQSPLMYNYEISTIPMKASMLVLSACNTGGGSVYSGEGVMSLSRSFILAGVQSVVHGLWRINDESSAVIMSSFYKYLAEGKSKDKALQLAKINYIKNASPELANSKYWAGLVIMGDHSALIKGSNYRAYILLGLFVVLITIASYSYFSPRRQ